MKDTFFGRLDYLIFGWLILGFQENSHIKCRLLTDTPPGTSDEHLTVVKLLKSVNPDGAVIVTTPQSVALDTIKKELAFCTKTSLPVLGIVENMGSYMCPCCQVGLTICSTHSEMKTSLSYGILQEKWDLFPNSRVEKFAVEHGIPYLGKIPVDPVRFRF